MKRSLVNGLLAAWMPVLLICGLSGCGVAMRWGDTSAEILPDSGKAMVIGGVKTIDDYSFTMTFNRYDPETQRLIPGGGEFFLWQTGFHSEPVARVVPPGHYIFTMSNEYRGWGRGTTRTTVGLAQFSHWNRAPYSDADVSDVKTYRFSIKPGEIIYIGEYEFGPYAPRWVNRQDELDKILAEMPQVKTRPPYRPPVEAKRLEAAE